MTEEVKWVTVKGKQYRIPYEGYKVGLIQETIVSSIGAALECLEEVLYSEPDNISVQAAKWHLEEAFNKIAAGEPANPYELPLEPITDHVYYTDSPRSE